MLPTQATAHRAAIRTFAAAALLLASFTGRPAAAQVTIETQTFKPSPFHNDGLTVYGGEGMEQWAWDVGLMLDYQYHPLTLRDVDTNEVTRVIVGNQVMGDLSGAFSIFKWLDLGLALPLVLYQDGDGWRTGPEPTFAGIGDLRLVPRLQAINLDDGLFALSVLPIVTAPTGQLIDPMKGDKNFTFLPTLAASTALPYVKLGLDVYYRLREDQSVGDFDLKDEIGYRLGAVGQVWPEHLDLIGELYGSTIAIEPFNDLYKSPLEGLLALRYHALPGLAFTLGGGGALTPGYAAPAFRVFGGVMYAMVPPLDRDDDGILDADDGCPDDAEDMDGFEDSDGCPDLDNDQDGIPDLQDKAPNDPEDKDGFEDEDGAPDPDNDQDGILDVDDKCPLEPETMNGVEDEDGCPDELGDSDEDGLLDNVDKCPQDPEDMDGFEDEDGCPDPDDDGDGVLDTEDRCPREAGPAENGGCPDTDRDGDTVVDRLDNCPDEAGSPEHQGCRKAQLVVLKKEKIEILEKVYFALNKDKILPRSFALLKNVASVLKAHPEIKKIRVEGHTDSSGPDAYNKNLSQRRSDSVKAYLEKQGVEASRLEGVGFGEERPVDTNDTKEGRANNRRVEFNIVTE